MFLKSLFKGVLLICSITLFLISNAFADNYPSKPIKLIVPYGAGGGGDTTSRFIADLATDISVSYTHLRAHETKATSKCSASSQCISSFLLFIVIETLACGCFLQNLLRAIGIKL